MRRHDLHILDIPTAVRPLVLDPKIRELNASIDDGQIVGIGPFLHLLASASRAAVTVAPVTVSLLEKGLVVPLQLVVKHYAIDARTVRVQTLGDA
jgi:hypothetical protein